MQRLGTLTMFFVSLAVLTVFFAAPHTVWAVAEPTPGAWTYGGGVGFIGNTPSHTAWAFNAHVDNFLSRNFSLGPLLQVAFTGALSQVGLSAQAKYWMEIPDTANRLRAVFQGGIGFLHADRLNSDNSFLIPIGAGLDYLISQRMALTTNFIVNFTDIDTGNGRDAHVMPSLTVGVRF